MYVKETSDASHLKHFDPSMRLHLSFPFIIFAIKYSFHANWLNDSLLEKEAFPNCTRLL
jgi:dolichyl-phosphate-mannose--protein O-mannosyl transferase